MLNKCKRKLIQNPYLLFLYFIKLQRWFGSWIKTKQEKQIENIFWKAWKYGKKKVTKHDALSNTKSSTSSCFWIIHSFMINNMICVCLSLFHSFTRKKINILELFNKSTVFKHFVWRKLIKNAENQKCFSYFLFLLLKIVLNFSWNI